MLAAFHLIAETDSFFTQCSSKYREEKREVRTIYTNYYSCDTLGVVVNQCCVVQWPYAGQKHRDLLTLQENNSTTFVRNCAL